MLSHSLPYSTMTTTRASCPASLSFIFSPVRHADFRKTGSVGVGCTIDSYVSVTAGVSAKSLVTFNGTPIHFPTVSYVMHRLTDKHIKVDITSSLPLGSGFGISGASAIASACAINALVGGLHTFQSLSEIAHESEIINKTGLGSIGTQITGGFLLKTGAGLPVRAIPLPFVGTDIYATVIGPLKTPSVLGDPEAMKRIKKSATVALSRLQSRKNISLRDVLEISYGYATQSGLLVDPETVRIVEEIRNCGGHATMAILGKVILSDRPPHSFRYPTHQLTITNATVRLDQ
jgi:pantoate kinase